MYKIGGLLFCLMTGFLIAHYGWMALLWATLGFIPGIFISANMVLPILMGVPIATSLIIKKQMRATVYFALFRAPIIWLVAFFLLGWFFPNAATWLYNNEPLNIAGNLGLLLILLSALSKKVRQDFRDDFDKSWGKYYRDYETSNNELKNLASIKDKKQSKQVEAGIKVFYNLYTHTTNKDDDSKYTLVPDAKYRYMIFCMSLFINCCENIIYEKESFIDDCISFLSVFMTSRENANEFFRGKTDIQEVKERTPSLLTEYLNNWASYNNALKKNDIQQDNLIICEMMHSTMSNEPLREADRKGLEEIALSIIETMPAMRSAFTQLLKK